MATLYSLTINPDKRTSRFVDGQKKSFKVSTGSFASSNSKAHITIAEFLATPEDIIYLMKRLKAYAKSQEKLNALFDSLSCSSYSNCAVYLPAPDDESKIHKIIKEVRELIRMEKSKICKPHISLGRKLSELQLKFAEENFGKVKFNCEIGQIALRKFNPTIGQFTIENKFSFGGDRSGGIQLSFWS